MDTHRCIDDEIKMWREWYQIQERVQIEDCRLKVLNIME